MPFPRMNGNYFKIGYGCFQMEDSGSGQQGLFLSRDGQINPSPAEEGFSVVGKSLQCLSGRQWEPLEAGRGQGLKA